MELKLRVYAKIPETGKVVQDAVIVGYRTLENEIAGVYVMESARDCS